MYVHSAHRTTFEKTIYQLSLHLIISLSFTWCSIYCVLERSFPQRAQNILRKTNMQTTVIKEIWGFWSSTGTEQLRPEQRWKVIRQKYHGTVSSKLCKNFGPWVYYMLNEAKNCVTDTAPTPSNSFTSPCKHLFCNLLIHKPWAWLWGLSILESAFSFWPFSLEVLHEHHVNKLGLTS